ncbi:uncharacterized protein LOC115633778 [Scaptodrosophila lebanonensis]|uniref:Uncharacterized protein LOC115633778 n=1 Tax=Drosophila lebanonensis TaxID=7225 RepID=A0A6J2UG55_DROLE|nr:uncharacterized protein LOC115633778 [Scaptodrosophila lebanonensis]
MAQIIRNFLNQAKFLPFWAMMVRNSVGELQPTKLELLQAERDQLATRCGTLWVQQRNIEVQLTELTRCIKRIEFDIRLQEKLNPKVENKAKQNAIVSNK